MMARRIGALVATALVGAIVTFVGVVLFFEPIASADPPSAPPLPAALGFLVYIILSVLLLDWVSREIGRPVKAALIISASQIILVSVDFVLRGERGIATGAASAVLILVTWTTMGSVYRAVLSDTKSGDDQALSSG
jgi:predicted Kef-type K+ transport protein